MAAVTLPGPFEAAVAELLDPVLVPRGFSRQPLEQQAAEWWLTYAAPPTTIAVHYEAGSGPWLTITTASGAPEAVIRVAQRRATQLGQALPPEPLGDLRAILSFNADLLTRYCGHELQANVG